MNVLISLCVSISFLASTNAGVTKLLEKNIFKKAIDPCSSKPITYETEVSLPDNFDWREKGAVSKVKNQGRCAHSDWAFAVMGALEAQLVRENGNLVELSVQELIDCSGIYGNHGCYGGDPKDSIRYIRNFGVTSEESYPYYGKKNKCKPEPKSKKIASNSSIFLLQISNSGSEDKMKCHVFQHGPVLATINVTESFMKYKEGIYSDEECEKSEKQQHVLIVGYGVTKESQQYWIVKNSWGEDWGEKGFIRIARNRNTCGIAENAYFITSEWE